MRYESHSDIPAYRSNTIFISNLVVKKDARSTPVESELTGTGLAGESKQVRGIYRQRQVGKFRNNGVVLFPGEIHNCILLVFAAFSIKEPVRRVKLLLCGHFPYAF